MSVLYQEEWLRDQDLAIAAAYSSLLAVLEVGQSQLCKSGRKVLTRHDAYTLILSRLGVFVYEKDVCYSRLSVAYHLAHHGYSPAVHMESRADVTRRPGVPGP